MRGCLSHQADSPRWPLDSHRYFCCSWVLGGLLMSPGPVISLQHLFPPSFWDLVESSKCRVGGQLSVEAWCPDLGERSGDRAAEGRRSSGPADLRLCLPLSGSSWGTSWSEGSPRGRIPLQDHLAQAAD